MRIAYYLTGPRPPEPDLDAAWQEIDQLRRTWDGPVEWLYPAASYRRWIPRRRLRRAQSRAWLRLDRSVDLHLVSSDRPIRYRLLSRLRRPVVCRLLLAPTARASARAAHGSYRALVVSSTGEAKRLRSWGLPWVESIPPAIDVERFGRVPPPPEGPFTLLMASAPWTARQFRTKGVDALLSVLADRPDLRLVLLWRGVLAEEMARRIDRAGLADRVELIARKVDPADVLRRVHAAVLVTSSRRVVKSFPHSLLEALAAGRPVVTSPGLGISELVRQEGCGVLAGTRPAELAAAIDSLVRDYPRHRDAAARLDLDPFSRRAYLAAYDSLFARVTGLASTG